MLSLFTREGIQMKNSGRLGNNTEMRNSKTKSGIAMEKMICYDDEWHI